MKCTIFLFIFQFCLWAGHDLHTHAKARKCPTHAYHTHARVPHQYVRHSCATHTQTIIGMSNCQRFDSFRTIRRESSPAKSTESSEGNSNRGGQ